MVYQHRQKVINLALETLTQFQFIEHQWRNDRQVALAAVSMYGKALEYASLDLRDDREVVLAAVTQDGEALAFQQIT